MSKLLLGQAPPSPPTPLAPDKWIRRLATLPLVYQPGKKWLYNTGSDRLGELFARLGQAARDVLARENLRAAPLLLRKWISAVWQGIVIPSLSEESRSG